jgi:hypothetical protein
MAVTTYRSPQYSQNSSIDPQRPILWEEEYVIENLPRWIYTDNKPPESITECKAHISSIEYTLKDIDLQIEIRELELKTGNSRHQSTFEYDKWRVGALRAKQNHLYLLNAHKYWLIKNTTETVDSSQKLDKLIALLVEDPADFCAKAQALLQ